MDHLGQAPSIQNDPILADRIDSTRFVVASTLTGYEYRPTASDVGQLLNDAIAESPRSTKVEVGDQDHLWAVDSRSLSIAVTSAAEAALDRGATRLLLRAGPNSEGELRIMIGDDGTRIDELAARRVLDSPMITELDHSDLGSTGLSVLIAQMVAEAHGGSVTVRSSGPADRPGSSLELKLTAASTGVSTSQAAHLNPVPASS